MRERTGLFRGMLSLSGLEDTGGAAQGWGEYIDLGFRSELWVGDGDLGIVSLETVTEAIGGAHPGRMRRQWEGNLQRG